MLFFSNFHLILSPYLLKCAAQHVSAGLSYIVSFFWKSSCGMEWIREMEMWGMRLSWLQQVKRKSTTSQSQSVPSVSLLAFTFHFLPIRGFQLLCPAAFIWKFCFRFIRVLVSFVDIISLFLPLDFCPAACFICSVPTDHQEEGEVLYKYCTSFLFFTFLFLSCENLATELVLNHCCLISVYQHFCPFFFVGHLTSFFCFALLYCFSLINY